MDSTTFDAGIHHLTVAKQYATASWVLSLYEYLITFDREVQSIWQRRFSFATVLWVLNRYTLPISYCGIVLAFYLPLTTQGYVRCLTFVKFPGTIQIISNISTGLTLSLRVYALYGRAWWVLAILFPFLAAEVAIEAWAVAGGIPVPIPPGQVGCILTGKPTQGDRFAAFWIGQLVFPSIIFVMTLLRIAVLRKQGFITGGILGLMLRDGVMYFLVIFIVNLANVLTYVIAPPDIQAINATFSALVTAMMICRLMLNLRSVPEKETTSTSYSHSSTRLKIIDPYIGNLGEDLDIKNVDNRQYSRETAVLGSGFSKRHDYELSTLSTLRGGVSHVDL